MPQLDENDKQAIAFLLVKGTPMPDIIHIYTEGRRGAIKRLQESIANGELVLFNGRWLKKEDAEKVDTSKAGVAAQTSASAAVIGKVATETVTRAVDMEAELMKLGTHVRNNYIGTATQDAQTVEEFLQSATDFLMNHGMISTLRFRNVAMADYIDVLKLRIAKLEQQA